MRPRSRDGDAPALPAGEIAAALIERRDHCIALSGGSF